MARNDIGASGAIYGTRPVDEQLPRRNPRRNSSDHEDPEAQEEDVRRAFAELKAAAEALHTDLHLRFDDDLGAVVVTVREPGGERVLRQVPAQEVLRLARLLRAGRQQIMDRLI
jgi:uncharacterized FlaG/YvyC family protein